MAVIGALVFILMPLLIVFGWMESHAGNRNAGKWLSVIGFVLLMLIMIFVVVIVSI